MYFILLFKFQNTYKQWNNHKLWIQTAVFYLIMSFNVLIGTTLNPFIRKLHLLLL